MTTANAIDLLGWLPMTRRLSTVLEGAFEGAAQAGRPEATVEHVLAWFLEDVDATAYFATRGVELEHVRDYCWRVIGEAAMPPAAVRGTRTFSDNAPPPEEESASPQIRLPLPPLPNTLGMRDNAQSWTPPGAPVGQPGGHSSQPAWSTTQPPEHRSSSNPFSIHDPAPSRPFSLTSPPPPTAAPPSAHTLRPIALPSRALRKLLARACHLAEEDGRYEVDSESVIRAIALDEHSECGRVLRRLLPQQDPLAPPLEEGAEGEADGEAVELADQEVVGEAEQDAIPEPAGPAYTALVTRSEVLLNGLQRELQKDRRYRIANDLAAFVATREPTSLITHEGANLGQAALPILHATRAELERHPLFRAFEQVRSSLRLVKNEQHHVGVVLGSLIDDGVVEPETPLAQAVHELIDVTATTGERPPHGWQEPPRSEPTATPPRTAMLLEVRETMDNTDGSSPGMVHDAASLRELASRVDPQGEGDQERQGGGRKFDLLRMFSRAGRSVHSL